MDNYFKLEIPARVSSRRWTSKPDGYLAWSTVGDLRPENAFEVVNLLANGHSAFTANGNKKETGNGYDAKTSQMIFFDIEVEHDGEITGFELNIIRNAFVAEQINLFDLQGLKPFAYYPSFSNGVYDKEKDYTKISYRFIFVLDKTVDVKIATKFKLYITKETDIKVDIGDKQANRLSFGGCLPHLSKIFGHITSSEKVIELSKQLKEEIKLSVKTVVAINDSSDFAEYIRNWVSKWADTEDLHNTIRYECYAPCIIMAKRFGEEKYLGIFLEELRKVRPDKHQDYVTSYIKHDTNNIETNTEKLGRAWHKILAQFDVIDECGSKTFDILNGATFAHLKKGEYISADFYAKLDTTKNNLVVAPAGTGKTSSLFAWGLNSGKKILILVPTKAIAEKNKIDMEDKPYRDSVSFVTGDSKDEVGIWTKVVFCTNDQADNFTAWADCIFIDEAHFVASLYKLGSKEYKVENRRLTSLLQTSKCTVITATPFNLFDGFDNKYVFTKDIEYDIKQVYECNSFSKDRLGNLMLECKQRGKKFAVLINSRPKQKKWVEHYKSSLEFRSLNIQTLSSGKDKQINKVLQGDLEDFDGVFTTSILNCGVDLQGIFDVLICVHRIENGTKTHDINSHLQFFNRDRQASEFYFFSIGDTVDEPTLNLNTTLDTREFKEEQTFLTPNIVNGRTFNENLYVDTHYASTKVFDDELIKIMKMIYPNYRATLKLLDGALDKKEDKEDETLETMVRRELYMDKYFMEDYDEYVANGSRNVSEFLKHILTKAERNAIYFAFRQIKNGNMELKQYIFEDVETWVSKEKIAYYPVVEVRELAKEIADKRIITLEDKERLVSYCNELCCYDLTKDCKWSGQNFCPRMASHFGVKLESVSENNRVLHYINVGVEIDVTNIEYMTIAIREIENHLLLNNGVIGNKELKVIKAKYELGKGEMFTGKIGEQYVAFLKEIGMDMKKGKREISGKVIKGWKKTQ